MRPWMAEIARRVYAEAGLGPADTNLACLQDAAYITGQVVNVTGGLYL